MKVLYPGSFDPITYGHVDLIERSAAMFDEVIVAIMVNDGKRYLFPNEERVALIEESISHIRNARVVIGKGLTVDYAKEVGCSVLVRGIRAVMDYDAEMQQAIANRTLSADIETVFLVASPKYSFISSSLARTIASYHGNLDPFVPKHVRKALQAKYKE